MYEPPERGLVGGDSNGEYSNGAVTLEKPGEEGGSKNPLEYEEFLEVTSEGGEGHGKQVAQVMGLSWVQSIDVGP